MDHMKIHGTCRWCHHWKHDHQGKPKAEQLPPYRWTTTACTKQGCPCPKYKV